MVQKHFPFLDEGPINLLLVQFPANLNANFSQEKGGHEPLNLPPVSPTMSFRLLSKKCFHFVHKSIGVTLVWRLFMEKWVISMDTPYTNAHCIKSIPNTDPHIPCAQNRNPLLEFWEYHPSKLNAIPWKSESNFWKGRQVKTLRPHPCIVCHYHHHQYF